jgi:hypothetical protein
MELFFAILVRGALEMSIVKNVSIFGNCLGSREDLDRAIQLKNWTGTRIIIDQEYQVDYWPLKSLAIFF